TGVRPDREGERAADGMAVDGDDAPVDEVPALRQVLERHVERVRVARRARREAGGHVARVRVGDRDDREARLDGLVVGERDLGRRGVDDAARRRRRAHEVRVRRRRHGQHERCQCRDESRGGADTPPVTRQASCLPPPPEPPRATSAKTPRRTPTTPTISATIASVELPPPPSELFAATVGDGVSDDSLPFQLTIEPSEYDCSTPNVYVLLDCGSARKPKTASSSVGTLPPVHVTLWTTALSPEPDWCVWRFQPGAGANESIEK